MIFTILASLVIAFAIVSLVWFVHTGTTKALIFLLAALVMTVALLMTAGDVLREEPGEYTVGTITAVYEHVTNFTKPSSANPYYTGTVNGRQMVFSGILWYEAQEDYSYPTPPETVVTIQK